MGSDRIDRDKWYSVLVLPGGMQIQSPHATKAQAESAVRAVFDLSSFEVKADDGRLRCLNSGSVLFGTVMSGVEVDEADRESRWRATQAARARSVPSG